MAARHAAPVRRTWSMERFINPYLNLTAETDFIGNVA